MQFLTIFMLSFASLGHAKKTEVQILQSGFIYESAPFPECHASTLLETNEGILAAWFGGTHERHPDVSIYTARLKDQQWSEPEKVADGVIDKSLRYPTWNPVLYQLENGKTVLFYKIGPSPREWWGAYKISEDLGKSWSEEIPVPDGFLGPIKNKPVSLPHGKILYPSSLETSEKWNIYVETSDSNLKNWKKTSIDNGTLNAIQPTVFFHPDGKLQLLCRTKEGKIGVTWSCDSGESWTPVSASNLVNNNSGIDGITLKNGYHLLLCNPIPKGRNKLSLMGSTDGIKWIELLILENEEKGEFSYPAIIQAEDETVHLTYTYNRKKLKYTQLKIKTQL